MWRWLVLQSIVLASSSLALTPTLASAQCSNETLRSELRSGTLPDCRAYEQVTPVYKEGVNLTSEFAISQDGAHLIGGGTGVFAGAEGDKLGNAGPVLGAAYEFSRTASGWAASSLGPPASQFNNNGMYDASADLSTTLWELGTNSQPFELTDFSLYLERPRGTFTKIGPATPSPTVANGQTYTYVGASADLSHVFFAAIPAFRWPFDTTLGEGSTLYEYVGTGNTTPALVGVDSAGHQISQCGTRLGSSDTIGTGLFSTYRGSMYNAISASGERVFFTAIACGEQPPVNELFAREEIAPSQSRTVSVSEPTEAQCSECRTAHTKTPTVEMPAEFEGASEDGSKAFFTTEQELLPGATGNNLYQYDFNAPEGNRVSRVSIPVSGEAHVQGVTRISEDGSHVYFVATGRLSGENAEHQQPHAGEDNLYVFERDARFPEGRLSFIATLSPEDALDWQREDERPAQLSRDGRFLVFLSQADLTREGTSPGKVQVFQYDDQTGSLVRASIGQNGFHDNHRTPVFSPTIATGGISGSPYSQRDSPTMADGVLAPEDGAVFFESPDALTPQALDDEISGEGVQVPNIYEYRAGNVYLISDGRDTSTISRTASVHLLGSDATGGDVFFTTADSLIPQDTDTQQDFYDARVGGGFPNSAGSPGCSGDVCQGASSLLPALPAPNGSAIQAAEGNQAAVSMPVGKPKLATLAQKLAKALKACRKRPKSKRSACERQARKSYGANAKKTRRAG
jgi:hypothetical protein